jgi:hypothetical protein
MRFRRPALVERSQPGLRLLGFAGICVLSAVIVANRPVIFVNGLENRVPLAAEFATRNVAVDQRRDRKPGPTPPHYSRRRISRDGGVQTRIG